MKYTILINYDTGDSFTHTSGLQDTVKLEWELLENAKVALQYITQHYEYYKLLSGKSYFFSKQEKENAKLKIEEAKSKPWFVDNDEYCLKLLADNGNEMQLRAFWCGYFESLNFAEIVVAESELDRSTDTKVYF